MKISITKLNQLLTAQGYTTLLKAWRNDGLWTAGHRKPKDTHMMPWEPEWSARKSTKNFVFHLMATLDTDGGTNYYWVLDLKCFKKKRKPLHARGNLRGPYLRAEICDITEADLPKLPQLEKVLQQTCR